MKLAELNAVGGVVEYMQTEAGDVCVFVNGKTAWLDPGEFEILFTPQPEDEKDGL